MSICPKNGIPKSPRGPQRSRWEQPPALSHPLYHYGCARIKKQSQQHHYNYCSKSDRLWILITAVMISLCWLTIGGTTMWLAPWLTTSSSTSSNKHHDHYYLHHPNDNHNQHNNNIYHDMPEILPQSKSKHNNNYNNRHGNHDHVRGTHYIQQPQLQQQQTHVKTTKTTTATKQQQQKQMADAIVIGSGLAGLTAALQLLDRGGTVILLEKESMMGGNSNKASSGMNACCLAKEENNHDSLELFFQDTLASAGGDQDDVTNIALISTMVQGSASALEWIQSRVGVDMSVLVQLGGHSRPRTHRPSQGFVGAELISSLEQALVDYQASGRFQMHLNTQVTELLYAANANDDDDSDPKGQRIGQELQPRVLGVKAVTHTSSKGEEGGIPKSFYADHVVLATGGFASDRSKGSYLEQYRPDLLGMAATAGVFSTGDGITLAQSMGAITRDMDKVQLHPTGFVDPSDPTNPQKVLAAELLRGVGGILVTRDNNNKNKDGGGGGGGGGGRRFCNELGTRAYISDRMLQQQQGQKQQQENIKDPKQPQQHWDPQMTVPTFYLILSSEAAQQAQKHVNVYHHRGLLTSYQGIDNLAQGLQVDESVLTQTIQEYQTAAAAAARRDDNGGSSGDVFGKTVFPGVFQSNLQQETYWVGIVTPVLHYCMGGITIDPQGHVLNQHGTAIPGLYAAGEVTGGVHGNNRLGGNSLLECAVYGSIIGSSIPINPGIITVTAPPQQQEQAQQGEEQEETEPDFEMALISWEELAQHRTPEDSWIVLYDKVYDLTSFATSRHPGGAKSIHMLAGRDGTSTFASVHSPRLLPKIQPYLVGDLDTNSIPTQEQQQEQQQQDEEKGGSNNNNNRLITMEELQEHNTKDDCWVLIHDTVYDLTEFSPNHPGGPYLIQKMAGKDATMSYRVFHPLEKLQMVQSAIVGKLLSVDEFSTE